MAFKNLRILLLINCNDGFIDGDELVVLYSLYASKNLNFSCDSYAPFDLKELESFAEFRFEERDIRILKEVWQIPDTTPCSQNVACDGFRRFRKKSHFTL